MVGSSHGLVGSLTFSRRKTTSEINDLRNSRMELMSENQGLLSGGLGLVARNKRYLIWFWLLNLTLAELGTAAFRTSAHSILDHSFAAGSLFHRFDFITMIELFGRPEFGPANAKTTPSFDFAFVFFLSSALFLPGVFLAYASNARLPRDDFFRACGRNLWRFIRILLISGIIMSIVTGILFLLQTVLLKKVDQSTNELLPFQTRMLTLALIFLIISALRIWFDLAEVDTVLNDQPAVRKSIWAALKHTLKSLPRLLTSYVVTTIFAALVLVAGLWIWLKFVSPESLIGAFLVGQITLFLLLIPRFWQRGVAVSYWQQEMVPPPPVAVAPPIPLDPVYPRPIIVEVPESTPIAPDTLPPLPQS
jgi:hypothetical protein